MITRDQKRDAILELERFKQRKREARKQPLPEIGRTEEGQKRDQASSLQGKYLGEELTNRYGTDKAVDYYSTDSSVQRSSLLNDVLHKRREEFDYKQQESEEKLRELQMEKLRLISEQNKLKTEEAARRITERAEQALLQPTPSVTLKSVYKSSLASSSPEPDLVSLFRTPTPPTQRKTTLDDFHKRQLGMFMQTMTSDIIRDVTTDLAHEVASELTYLYRMTKQMADHLAVNSAEAVVTGNVEGRPMEDAAYHLIRQTQKQLDKERLKTRKDVWKHTLPLKKVESEKEAIEEIEDDEDTAILEFLEVIPFHLREDSKMQPAYRIYKVKEAQYWEVFKFSIEEIKLAKKLNGIQTAVVSHNNRHLALGSEHGDILIYDLWCSPPRPIRAISNENSGSDPIINISWSLDGTQLISLNLSSQLQLWSLQPGGIAPSELKSLDLKADEHGVLPSQLTQRLLLDAEKQDFIFQEGPLAGSGSQVVITAPKLSVFHPSFTLLGSQHNFLMVFRNNDIMKCYSERVFTADYEAFISTQCVNQQPVTEHSEVNYIGQEIPAELFRGHSHHIVFLGFIGHSGDMVTVDVKGYIYVWKYEKESLSHYGWFEPYRKFRLLMGQRDYTVDTSIEQVVHFLDKSKGKKSKQTAELEKKRKITEDFLKKVLPSKAWQKNTNPSQNILTQVYKPKVIGSAGNIFHLVQRMGSENGLLIMYATSLYKPTENHSVKLLDLKQTQDGNKLVFMMLFPATIAEESHISFISVHLERMKVEDFRIDIFLTKEQFSQCLKSEVCSFELTCPIDATGSVYIVTNVLGSLMAYSMNTGNHVMSAMKDDFVGLRLQDVKLSTVPLNAKVAVASIDGRLHFIIYAKNKNSVHILKIFDRNTAEMRRNIWKTFQTWDNHPNLPPSEQVLHRNLKNLEGKSNHVVEPYMRKLVYDLADKAIQQSLGDQWSKEKAKENRALNRIDAFKCYQTE